jgi:hypothetical protein
MLCLKETEGTLRAFQRAELEPPTLAYMPRLSKSDVEALLQSYDSDPTGCLLRALSVVLDITFSTWQQAVIQLPTDSFDTSALLREETEHLDALVKRLVENRAL